LGSENYKGFTYKWLKLNQFFYRSRVKRSTAVKSWLVLITALLLESILYAAAMLQLFKTFHRLYHWLA